MNVSNSRDDLDSLIPHTADAQRIRTAIDHLQSKINRTKELIKTEQNARDENVNEYLKLASNADKNQLQRIKSVFEKKNQKSAQIIAQHQKKLDNYLKRIKTIETHGLPHGNHGTRDIIRDMGQGIKDVSGNIKEFSGGVIGGIKTGISNAAHTAGEIVVSSLKKPSSSNDNLSGGEKPDDSGNTNVEAGECTTKTAHGSNTHTHSHSHSTKYTSDDESSSITSGSGHIGAGVGAVPSAGGSLTSPARHHLITHGSNIAVTETAATPIAMIDFEPFVTQLNQRRDEYQRLTEEVESLKNQLQNECTVFHQSLQEEKYRYERLEEQMNDLIELHQNEIENLKQGISDMEEKVQYQSEERLRDVHEMLESCQTRISRMEHQQHQHLQQLVNLDSLENSNARALVLKLINVVLTILQVILLLVATIANIVSPFLQTRIRIISSIVVLIVTMIICQQWPDIGTWIQQKVSERWIYLTSAFDNG